MLLRPASQQWTLVLGRGGKKAVNRNQWRVTIKERYRWSQSQASPSICMPVTRRINPVVDKSMCVCVCVCVCVSTCVGECECERERKEKGNIWKGVCSVCVCV